MDTEYDLVVELLEDKGVPRSEVVRPGIRLLWRCGIRLPPPIFMSYWQLVVFHSAIFAIFMSPVFVLASLRGWPIWPMLLYFLVPFFVAFMVRRKARAFGLPKWSKLLEESFD